MTGQENRLVVPLIYGPTRKIEGNTQSSKRGIVVSDLEEFQEVDNCGGQFKIEVEEVNGKLEVSTSYSKTGGFASVYGVYALAPQDVPVGVFFLGGIGQPFSPQPPDPSCISIFMPSDRAGYFGRLCPSCNKYFRTQSASVFEPVTCPYCGYVAQANFFLTEGHRKFIKAHVETYLRALETGEEAILDLDALSNETVPNRPPHYFVEEKQQTYFKCVKCGVKTDILGLFGYCPHCGHRNSFEIMEAQLKQLEARVNNPRYTSEQRQERENEWREIVKQCVSYFEGFARDLQTALLSKVPLTPTRRKAIEGISFHNPLLAAEKLQAYFDIDLFFGIDDAEKEFIKRRFLRRHIYEHGSGVVDQKYIDDSGDPSVKIGQLIRESSGNVATLIKLVWQMAANFNQGFHEIGY